MERVNPILFVQSPPVHHANKKKKNKVVVETNLTPDTSTALVNVIEEKLKYFTSEFKRRTYGPITIVLKNGERISCFVKKVDNGEVHVEFNQTISIIECREVTDVEWMGKSMLK